VESVKAEAVRSDINITPLVDVMLVLLIIFMVVFDVEGPPVIMPSVNPPKSQRKTNPHHCRAEQGPLHREGRMQGEPVHERLPKST
jgi:biopolymer transport protein ExbD